jgi:succinoglycan biosynthesis protein ExoO
LGLVPDLGPLYREAGVVISPLTIGSGLKIKLIEALGHGKAIVATSVTTEGCAPDVVKAIFERNDAMPFADAVIQLLTDDALRHAKATQALEAAKRFYSPEVCYRDLLAFAGAATTLPSASFSPPPVLSRAARR